MFGNKTSGLPDGGLYPCLASLYIQNNNLHTFSNGSLSHYSNLKSFKDASNTYVCLCDFVTFLTSEVMIHRTGDDLELYVCDSPDATGGKSVVESVFECHAALAFSLLCSAILAVILVIASLYHKFSVVRYLRMTWAWVRAKRKPKLIETMLEYDAFVSYRDMDSGWVEAHLVPGLDRSEPRLRLCLQKRDFIPAGWILDNIINAIEKSRKTLFILSQHLMINDK